VAWGNYFLGFRICPCFQAFASENLKNCPENTECAPEMPVKSALVPMGAAACVAVSAGSE
jgi:hypothetical protein